MTDRLPAAFWIDRSERTRLRLTGVDRAAFLHNLCTNEIKKLKPGQSAEAFVTSPQGKTIGFLTVYGREDDLIVSAEKGSLDLVLPHFAKYGVFSEVEINDITDSTVEFHLVGQLGGLVQDTTCSFADSPFRLPGLTVIVDRAMEGAWKSRLQDRPEIRGVDRESLRVAAGQPSFGRDVTPENLPQELARDTLAISFVKGCYLGQETVARLDALGHVNKLLRGMTTTSATPIPPGALLLAGEDKAGVVTSAARSLHDETTIAMGMIRTKFMTSGNRLRWEADGRGGEVVVADFPMFAMAENEAIP